MSLVDFLFGSVIGVIIAVASIYGMGYVITKRGK